MVFSDANTNDLVVSRKSDVKKRSWTSSNCYPDEGTEDLDHRTFDAAILWIVSLLPDILWRDVAV